MNKILDLRFVIGAFFTLVGLLLFGYSFFSETDGGKAINHWCGIGFTVFGIVMIVLSLRRKDNL